MIGPDRPLVLVGAGKMGGALLSGWLGRGLDPHAVLVIDPGLDGHAAAALREKGVRVEADVPRGRVAGLILLAVKPQVMPHVLPVVASLRGPDTIVVSIAAGITLHTLQAGLGDGPTVRTMPNTPCQVGKGVITAIGNAAATEAVRTEVGDLLSAVGAVYWVPTEADIDAATAVAGSGPAYVFHLTECLAAAARAAGLDPDLSEQLARGTVIGAAALLEAAEEDPATLRRNVTSPGGTTEAALTVLTANGGLQHLMREAVLSAARRSRELGS